MTDAPWTPERLHEALRQHFGYEAFRDGQAEAILNLLAGRDVVLVMPTGSGKSLCYQLTALLLPDVTVVVSPLIALMKDQVDALERQGIAATSSTHRWIVPRWRTGSTACVPAATSSCTSPPSASATGGSPMRWRRLACRFSRSTKRTASASGAMTSGPTISI